MEEDIKRTKKNKKRKIIYTITSICIITIITIILINKFASPSIVGKWCYFDGTALCYEFNNDSTGSYGISTNKNNLTYKTTDDILHVEYENNNINMPDVKFRIKNDTLILIKPDGTEIKYIKKEPETEQPQESREQQENQPENEEEIDKEHEEIERHREEMKNENQEFQEKE